MKPRRMIMQALEKMFGWDHSKALPKAREIALSLLRRTKEQIRDLHEDLERYREERGCEWIADLKGGEDGVAQTRWYCLNPRCIIREGTYQHTFHIDVWHVSNHPEELSLQCSYCGHDLVLKRDRDVKGRY